MNTHIIIFSKDRAMQLDALLHSMQKYAPLLFPVVLYKASPGYAEAYDIVKKEHGATAWWVYDNGFDACLKEQLLDAKLTLKEYIMFLVDDDIFYQPMPGGIVLPPDTAYAPRLGENTTYCYMKNMQQTKTTGDFDCTMSLDGHIYRTMELLPYFYRYSFSDPNDIETKLYAQVRPKLIYPEHSCLVGIPHNRVGPNTANRTQGGSAKELNDRFLAGERIDIDAMDFSNVYGSHQEIAYAFKRS